ncbi:MAG TPA: EamA family transporter [Azospirillaceae bacterium]|nr:EamA family transporter [Azospirillaceae bacterium]
MTVPSDPATLALLLILGSAVLHAVVNVLVKREEDKVAARALVVGTSGLLMLPAAFLVPLPTGETWLWLALSGAVHFGYSLLLSGAYDRNDLSVAYPIARGAAPLLTALGALLLFGEVPGPWQVAGLLLVSAGALGLGLKRGGLSGAVAPGVPLAVATGLAISLCTLVDAYGVRSAPEPLSFVVWFFLFDAPWLPLYVLATRRGRVMETLRRQGRRGAAAGLLSVGTYGMALYAFDLGMTAKLAALRETSVVFGTLIAVTWLGEGEARRRLACAGLVACGAAALAWG